MEFSCADVFETLFRSLADREALVTASRRLTYAELGERSHRFANVLQSHGVGIRKERSELAEHESGQDHVALYLYNGTEYLEAFFGSFQARAASINVNYRYVEEELLYLFENSSSRAVVYHGEFAPRIAAIRDRLPDLSLLIQVDDGSGEPLLPGALDYEAALAAASPERPELPCSPDDLYILYTGGTTGMPKGVLWRGTDIYVASMGGRKPDGTEHESLEALGAFAQAMPGGKVLVGPPLMHGAAQWSVAMMMGMGATLVFPNDVKRFDAKDFCQVVEREGASGITIVGDAFARPLLDEIATGAHDVSSLVTIGSGGAPLSVSNKKEFIERIPGALVFDGIGSSEAGTQGMNMSSKATGASTGGFKPGAGSVVVAEDLSRVLAPPDTDLGWMAMSGRVPLGYLGDPEKTARTFPVIDGVRYSVPGDRARYGKEGEIEVLGRDSVCINSGGEKIFAEEVEHALKQHPDVFDTIVAPRPSERWGQEVVAVVQLRADKQTPPASLLAEAEKHLARYKLPKAFVFVDAIVRSPSGKPDYRWAKEQAQAAG